MGSRLERLIVYEKEIMPDRLERTLETLEREYTVSKSEVDGNFLGRLDALFLSSRSELSPDKSLIKKAVINGNKTKDQSILLLDGVASTNILARLDFVESALRRGLEGISLVPVEMD